MVCLPLSRVFGWLMSVSPNKVAPELKENIITYQQECDKVLSRHWLGHLSEEHERDRRMLESCRAQLLFIRRYHFDRHPHWQPIYNRVTAGEQYAAISKAMRLKRGAVRYAIRRMLELGILDPVYIVAWQTGQARLAGQRWHDRVEQAKRPRMADYSKDLPLEYRLKLERDGRQPDLFD